MNKLYRNISVVILVTFLSCSEDFITKSDPDQVPVEVIFSDLTQVRAAVNGLYDGMQTANYYGRYFVLIPDLMGDGVRQSQNNSNRGTGQYRYEVTTNTGVGQGIWEDAYNVINRANIIIQGISEVEGDETLRNQLLGEALACRALAHFDLVRFFALPYNVSSGVTGANGEGGHLGVPVVTDVLSLDTKLSRNTVSEVYTQVINDLEDAKDLMNDEEHFSQYRFTSTGAAALLARVYLYKEDWPSAESEATVVINSGFYELLNETNYVSGFDGNAANSEAIFDLKFTNVDYNSTDQLGYMYSPNGYFDMLPTTDLDEVMEEISDAETDVRAAMWDTSVPIALKYIGPDNTAGVDNTHVIRLSEIYLIRAEARAKNSNPEGAREDLNELRANRGTEDTEATDPGLIAAIASERRIELAFEGHRLFDITRNGEDLVRNDCDLPNGNCVVSFPDHRFAHPIPQAEIDVNTNIKQNEGYN